MYRSKDPLGAPGVRFEEHRVEVENGVQLAVFEWTPEGRPDAPPMLFVAGWISLIDGWLPLLEVLVKDYRVYYVETREKRSADVGAGKLRPASFTIARLADDLIEVSKSFGLNGRQTLLFGSSMGSNAVLEALKDDRLEALAAFLIGPNVEFRFPWWGRPLVFLPPWVYTAARPFVLWYLRTFRVNAAEDPGQMARYERTVSAAEPRRIMLSARAVLGYSALPGLDTVSTPVAIAFARSDILHCEEEVQRIVDALPRGQAVECPSNTYMHTAAVSDEIKRYVVAVAAAAGEEE